MVDKNNKQYDRQEEATVPQSTAIQKYEEGELQLRKYITLVPGLRCNMSYAHFYDSCNEFAYKLKELVDNCSDSLDLEMKARESLINHMNSTHYFSEEEKKEASYASRRVEKAKKKKITAKEEDKEKAKKLYPTFNVEVCGRNFTQVYSPGSKGESQVQHKIIGGLLFSAIRDYYRFNRKKITEPSDFEYKELVRHSTIKTEFSFDDKFGCQTNPSLNSILPFVSNFIFPSTFLFVKSERSYRRKTYDHYELIVPVKISDVRYEEKTED